LLVKHGTCSFLNVTRIEQRWLLPRRLCLQRQQQQLIQQLLGSCRSLFNSCHCLVLLLLLLCPTLHNCRHSLLALPTLSANTEKRLQSQLT
jgi:hypothetical protein